MASTSTIESQLLILLEKLDEASRSRNGEGSSLIPPRPPMIAEVRTLELWRAVIAECLATVFFVFMVCGAYSPWTGKTPSDDVQLTIALVAGFSMAVLAHSFGQVSGGHLNPAVTLALAVTRRVSPLRAAMYVLAQLGGGIAGAALLYGATSSGYAGELGATVLSRVITPWQGFGIEFLLTFVVVFVVFASVNPYRRTLGSPAVAVGLAYLACTLVGLPLTGASMNPARSLGPAFVMNKWDAHWVYWVAPLLGGTTAGLIYEYIFNPHRAPRSRRDSTDGDSSSVGSEEDAYDECSKPPPRYNYNALRAAHHYDQYRPANTSTTASPLGYTTSVYGPAGAASVYSTPPYKCDGSYGVNKDEIYSGSKSLYAKSPPMPRSASLTRSQSVYTKPPPPRTDNYMRNIGQTQSIYNKSPGGFTALSRTDSMYATKNNPRQEIGSTLYVANKPMIVKPEPVYGISQPQPQHNSSTLPKQQQQQDSGDSSYSTYRGSYSSSRSSGPMPMSRNRADALTPNSGLSGGHSEMHTPNSIASYHSPNPQY
ncbi:MIP channel family protein big brain isoform X2 [Oratosquilla oratoria]|uniref:MIP channel family protein big brain isoform X2 n=1 Tax=Oratosquilla oratoria TaxID=337810 RepID=UPI003F76596F